MEELKKVFTKEELENIKTSHITKINELLTMCDDLAALNYVFKYLLAVVSQ